MSRRFFAALAAIAAVFVLLRPACELWNSHHLGSGTLPGEFAIESDGPSARCCATVSDPNFTAVVHAAPEVPDATPSAAPALALFTGTALLGWALQRLRAPPPNSHSYYVRSARILR